jgi:hypothetical protein
MIQDKSVAKACPFCGGRDLKFTYTMSYGHGDSGFNDARIICNGCSGSKGNGNGWGSPGPKDEAIAWTNWNKRNN